jgi:hypothetical protein
MKSINESDELWTSLSVEEVDVSEYQAACCLNARVNKEAMVSTPEIVIDNVAVSRAFLKSVLAKADKAAAAKKAAEVKAVTVKVKTPG